MFTPLWDITDTATLFEMSLHGKVAIDPDTGAYIWRSRKQAGVTIPTCNLIRYSDGSGAYSDTIILRFRRTDSDQELFVQGCARYGKWLRKQAPPK